MDSLSFLFKIGKIYTLCIYCLIKMVSSNNINLKLISIWNIFEDIYKKLNQQIISEAKENFNQKVQSFLTRTKQKFQSQKTRQWFQKKKAAPCGRVVLFLTEEANRIKRKNCEKKKIYKKSVWCQWIYQHLLQFFHLSIKLVHL